MSHFANDSIPFTSGFVDETSTDVELDEQTTPLDSGISDPLLVENNNNEDSTDSSNSSNNFQEDRLEIDSGAKLQGERLEEESSTKSQEDSLELESSTKFQKNSLVFAKLSGHSDPPWPARVAKVCWKNEIHYGYEVFFYGTYQVGIVLTDKVWAYNGESLSKFSKPKNLTIRKRGDFSRGLIEIRDCPDIAPSRDIQESASQIAKKLIRSSAVNDDLNVQRKRAGSIGVVATSTPDRSSREVKEQGINEGLRKRMTGIKKIQDKNKSKPSSSILSPLRKQDSSSDSDDEVHPNKKMKLPGNGENTSTRNENNTRRSKRVKKLPYWKRLDDINKTAAQSQNTPKKNTSLETIPLQNQHKATATYQLRNLNKSLTSKDVEDKIDTKREKANTLKSNTPNYRRESSEISPRPQKKPEENRNTPARRASAINADGRSEEAFSQSKSNANALPQSKPSAKTVQNSNSNVKVAKSFRHAGSIQSLEADCWIIKEEPLSENPKEWTVAQTVSFLIRMDPSLEPEDIRPIREHKIDGSALIQLNFHDFVTYCKIRVGPAIKICNLVKTIKDSGLSPDTNNKQF